MRIGAASEAALLTEVDTIVGGQQSPLSAGHFRSVIRPL